MPGASERVRTGVSGRALKENQSAGRQISPFRKLAEKKGNDVAVDSPQRR